MEFKQNAATVQGNKCLPVCDLLSELEVFKEVSHAINKTEATDQSKTISDKLTRSF